LGEESQIEELINFDLGTLVNDETWVNSIKIGDREAIVEHAEGAALTVRDFNKIEKKNIFLKLTIRTETKPNVVRHISKFSNFTGTIGKIFLKKIDSGYSSKNISLGFKALMI